MARPTPAAWASGHTGPEAWRPCGGAFPVPPPPGHPGGVPRAGPGAEGWGVCAGALRPQPTPSL